MSAFTSWLPFALILLWAAWVAVLAWNNIHSIMTSWYVKKESVELNFCKIFFLNLWQSKLPYTGLFSLSYPLNICKRLQVSPSDCNNNVNVSKETDQWRKLLAVRHSRSDAPQQLIATSFKLPLLECSPGDPGDKDNYTRPPDRPKGT